MRHIGNVFNRTALLAFLACCAAVRLIQADPSDDFSFSLAHGPQVNAYWLMSEKRVAEIFSDNLDLFPKSQTPKLAHHLMALCQKYRFDPAFVLAMIQVESRFKSKALSPVGAVGLMQVMPSTAGAVIREMNLPYDPAIFTRHKVLMDPYVNLTVGVTYLAWLRDHYQGMPPYYLVAAYNAGPAKIDELIAKGEFKPVQTKRYFEAVRRGVGEFRFYQRTIKPVRAKKKRPVTPDPARA